MTPISNFLPIKVSRVVNKEKYGIGHYKSMNTGESARKNQSAFEWENKRSISNPGRFSKAI